MANLVGCAAMSHAPQLMLNPDNWHLLNTRAGEHLPEKEAGPCPIAARAKTR